MNGYTIMADSYREMAERGVMTQEDANSAIRVYEFLATCSVDDLCTMVDSSAFNDIIRAFLKRAVVNADLPEEQQDRVMNQLRYTFDEKTAREVLG